MKSINNDVPIEEVNKVIKQSEEEEDEEDEEEDSQEVIEEDGYLELTEEAAKKELDNMLVPDSEGDGEVEQELVTKTVPVDNRNSFKPIKMNLLQFKCSNCDSKSYVNLEDEKINPLKEKVKCFDCGKKKAIKKLILNVTINGIIDYKPKEKIVDKVDEEDLTEL